MELLGLGQWTENKEKEWWVNINFWGIEPP